VQSKTANEPSSSGATLDNGHGWTGHRRDGKHDVLHKALSGKYNKPGDLSLAFRPNFVASQGTVFATLEKHTQYHTPFPPTTLESLMCIVTGPRDMANG
jgi:hypothetical protein